MRFVSRKKDLRVVLKPTDRIIDDQRRPIMIRGITAEFVSGMYLTDNEEIIASLLAHPLYGSQFVSAENDAQWKEQHPEVKMITGATTTTALSTDGHVDNTPKMKEPIDIDTLIAEKVASELSKQFGGLKEIIAEAVATSVNPPKEPVKPKVFHCPVCGEQLPNGIEVGRHKREKHPELYPPVEPALDTTAPETPA